MQRFFKEQSRRIATSMRSTLPTSKAARMKADPLWWNPEVEDAELKATMREIYADVGRGALMNVADAVGKIIPKGTAQAAIGDLLQYGGTRIVDINERTRQALAVEVAEGTRRGYSIPQLIEGVPGEGFRGVMQAGLDNGVSVWSDTRAETIARTETMLSYNRATVTGYAEFGVTHLLAYDGDEDPECADRNGQEFTVEEALDIEDHPNGTLVWSPVVEDRPAEGDAAPEDAAQQDAPAEMTAIDANQRMQDAGFLGGELTGLEPQAMERMVIEAERLAADFPKVMENIQTYVEMGQTVPRAYAATGVGTYNGIEGTSAGLIRGQARLTLNQKRFADLEQLRLDLAKDYSGGWLGGDSIEYVLAHEFGHIIDAATKEAVHALIGARSAAYRPLLARQGGQETAAGLTKYGTTDTGEFVAEVFAQWRMGANFKGTNSPAEIVQRFFEGFLR